MTIQKPIIATTLSGLFLKHEPWDKAHVLWFKERAKELRDNSVNDWAKRPDYFKGVDKVMKRLYPQLNDYERTIRARELFFDSVCDYVKSHPKVRNKDIITYFKSLKEKYRLALVTTNTRKALARILNVSGLEDLFDIMEFSFPKEKDDKRIVFQRFIVKYGKPIVYIGGSRKDSFDYCQENNIPYFFANLEGEEEIPNVESAHNLREIKTRLKTYL